MQPILLTVSYDGTNYSGFQRQNNAVTVQEILEDACEKILKNTTPVIGASRTDAGVHALGQRVVAASCVNIPAEKIPYALNSALPQDIVVTAAQEVCETFHPRYDAKRKTYEYKILNANFPLPNLRNYTEFVNKPLDVNRMADACKYFEGRHDFKAFCAAGSGVKSTERTIFNMSVAVHENVITISVCGDGFLYNMVRIIAGTLIYVGLGKLDPGDISKIIESKDRALAGKTAGPSGLTLVGIEYSVMMCGKIILSML